MRIVVSTCNKSAYLMSTFWKCFDRAWPECPYDQYVLYNWRLLPRTWWENMPVDYTEDMGWSNNLLRWLQNEHDTGGKSPDPSIGESFLLLLDDYFLVDIDEALIKKAHVGFKIWGAGCMRLLPCPGPERAINADMGYLNPISMYSVSFQASIWQPDALLSVLAPDETPWQAEIEGSKRRLEALWPFYGTTRNAMSYQNYLRRGNPQVAVEEWLIGRGIDPPSLAG